jgi:hypothetical protein
VAGGQVSYELSPLTTVTAVASYDRSRFRRSPQRNTDGGLAAIGIQMNRPALLSGSAQIGWRWFEPLLDDVETFRGLTGRANLAYTRPSGLSLAVAFNRDTQFSYSQRLAYFVFTDLGVHITHRPGGWRLIAGTGYRWLDYTHARTTDGQGRVDHVTSVNGTISHRVGRGMEIGVTGNHLKKSGVLAFSGTRAMVFWSLGGPYLMRFDRPLPGEL